MEKEERAWKNKCKPTVGYVSSLTKRPSIPSNITEIKHMIMPNNMIVLQTGCEYWMTLEIGKKKKRNHFINNFVCMCLGVFGLVKKEKGVLNWPLWLPINILINI